MTNPTFARTRTVLAKILNKKIQGQIDKAGLPQTGSVIFEAKLITNRNLEEVIVKQAPGHGPRKGKKGYVDVLDRIWIRDRAHAGLPDHWDVQEDDGRNYFRVDDNGNKL
jgi:hypothetical protein